MQATQYNITLDLKRESADFEQKGKGEYIRAKQGDGGSRFVCVTLTDSGEQYVPSDGVQAHFRCVKPDGNAVYNPAVINEDGTITVELTDQTLAVSGIVTADICLCGESGEVLSSVPFQISVIPAPIGNYADSSYELLGIFKLAGLVEKNSQLLTRLEQDVEDLKYVPIAFEGASVVPSTMELGSSTDGVIIEFRLNKEPASLTLDGQAITAESLYSGDMTHGLILLDGLAVSERTEFKLQATDERDALAAKTVTINFYNGVYYGVVENGVQIDSKTIVGDPDSEDADAYYGWTIKLQSSKALTFTVNAGSTQQIAYALPTRYGTPKFTVGGFEGGFYLAKTFDMTNSSGYTESYDVWLSDNVGLGSTTVVVT